MLPYRVALGLLFAIALSGTLTLPVEASPQAFVSVSGDDGDPNNPGNIEPINPKPNCGPMWPCRTFARALSVVDDGGEVVALTSGDYDPFSIGKSVSVVTAPGVHAVITATSGSAITIDTSGVVALRGLTLNGSGGDTGINVVRVSVLDIEDCALNAFTGNAIAFVGGRLRVRDTTVRNSGSDFASAIYIADGNVSIDRLRMDQNRHGIVVDRGWVTIRDSVAARQIVHALWARGATYEVYLTIENCTITGTEMGSGIIAGDPSAPHHWVRIYVSNSTVTSNATGISAFPPVSAYSPDNITVWVSNTTIAMNQKGVAPSGGAAVRSRGNNTLEGNADDGNFTWGFSAK